MTFLTRKESILGGYLFEISCYREGWKLNEKIELLINVTIGEEKRGEKKGIAERYVRGERKE